MIFNIMKHKINEELIIKYVCLPKGAFTIPTEDDFYSTPFCNSGGGEKRSRQEYHVWKFITTNERQ